jgi:hypothetical protein
MLYHTEKGALFGKEFTKKPECPFCGLPMQRPTELKVRRYGDMPVGSCSCGAVYACDPSGNNLGSAFIEALVFGCDMDWDLAWSLLPGDDYMEKLVENYDIVNHVIVPGGFYGGRRISGALYFVRMHRDIREVTLEGVQQKLDRARTAGAAPPPAGPEGHKALTRKDVEHLVREYRVEPLITAAGHNKRILRDLQRLLYSGDHLVRNRAVEVLGKASAVIARRDPGTVANLLQELLNSVTAPGSSSWGSIEAAGEIIGGSPDLFAGYLPPMYTFLGDPDHRPRTLRAIARVARTRPDLLRGAAFRLMPCLQDPDPEVRGYAALLFGSLAVPEAGNYLESIKEDTAEISVYKDGVFEKMTVGRLAAEALNSLSGSALKRTQGPELDVRRREMPSG